MNRTLRNRLGGTVVGRGWLRLPSQRPQPNPSPSFPGEAPTPRPASRATTRRSPPRPASRSSSTTTTADLPKCAPKSMPVPCTGTWSDVELADGVRGCDEGLFRGPGPGDLGAERGRIRPGGRLLPGNDHRVRGQHVVLLHRLRLQRREDPGRQADGPGRTSSISSGFPVAAACVVSRSRTWSSH